MNKTPFRLAAALCALGAVSSAHADDVTFLGFAHGSESVNYSLNSGASTIGVAAGGFSTVLNGSASFTSYCVDLAETIAFGTLYTHYVQAGASHVFANSDAYADLGRLYAVAGPVLDAAHEAAFQIAAWEIAYETAAGYGLDSGVARFSGGSAANSALGIASSWLTAVEGASGGPAVNVLERRGSQDVIYAPVPEPSTVALMLAGFAGMATMARRRKQQQRG